MKPRKLVHRLVSAEQAILLHRTNADYRRLEKLLRYWETEADRMMNTSAARWR